MPTHLTPVRAMLAAGAAAATVAAVNLPGDIAESRAQTPSRSAEQQVRAAVQAESRKIAATSDGIARAERRLAALTARERDRRARFVAVQDDLVRERVRLTRVERKNSTAKAALGDVLAAAYRRGQTDLVSIVLDADGVADAVERVEFERRLAEQNGKVLEAMRRARRDAQQQEERLQRQQQRLQALAAEAAESRDQANAVRSALLRRQASQIARRDDKQRQLSSIRARIRRAEAAQLAAARRARDAAAATAEAPRVASGGGGSSSPAGSSSSGSSTPPAPNQGGVVARVVAAASQIATTPYVWGGGHGGSSGGYDCSGSISYALAAGGLLSSPLASGGFMSWGEPGPGKRITVYANAGHAYMVVDGRRFDTSALRSGGTRWTSQMRSSAGFVARHPAGF